MSDREEAGAGARGRGGELEVSVISPTTAAFRGAAESVVAPAHDGKVGILRGHAPMTVLLGEGELAVRSGGETRRFQVSRGFLQVVDDEVSVLAERVQPAGDREGEDAAG